jgi:predicted nucleic acid-binding Zn finger protein
VEILSKNGAQYRTVLMTDAHAESFAAALRANSQWDGVMVYESPRAKSERRYYVVYHPASDAAREALLARQESKRAARADAELDEYLIVPAEEGRFFWVASGSGNVYEVTDFSCTCPDHEYRCREAGIRCKHQLALEIATERGKVLAA